MTKSEILFFELLQVCTGARNCLKHSYSDEDWEGALQIAREQTVTGVMMTALERLPKEQLPSKVMLLQWLGLGQIVVDNSKKLADASREVIRYFRENGFACHILKGSSVARYYPVPLRRTSGDVDVWLDGTREEIYDFARKFDKDGKLYGVNYHHIHFHLMDDVHIEVHIWPSSLSSPLRNRRLQKFCNLHRPTMDTDMPSLAFDRVFILLHGFQHLCGHGVGLRQLMDYYYVLKQSFDDNDDDNDNDNDNLNANLNDDEFRALKARRAAKACTNDDDDVDVNANLNDDVDVNDNDDDEWRRESVYWITQLGMKRFAEGLMWVFQRVFGMEEKYLLFKPNEKEGKFIMEEVMQTGNMGHSETRNWGSLKTPLSRFFYNLRRDLHLATHYPHEALWQPFFSLWTYAWRMRKGLLKDGGD